MTKTKELTPTDYAKTRGITLQAVTKTIRKHIRGDGPPPTGIKEVRQYGRFYLLIPDNIPKK
jgi:hypothetical protein